MGFTRGLISNPDLDMDIAMDYRNSLDEDEVEVLLGDALMIEEEEEIQQEIEQEVRQEIEQEVRQESKQEVKQEVEQELMQEVEQDVGLEVKQEVEQEAKQESQREVQQETNQEAEGNTNTPVVPEDIIIPAAVVVQEDVKPVLNHAVKRPSSINIESRPHDKHRRRAMVRTTTPLPDPSSHAALVHRSLPTTTPAVQPPNLSMPASPAPEVMATLDPQQAVPIVYARRTVGRYIPGDPTLQKAEIARLRATVERREEQHRDWLERIVKGAEESARSTAQWSSWQAKYSHLWTRKSDAQGQIERLENRIEHTDRRIGFAKSSKYVHSFPILCQPLFITVSRLCFSSHLTKEILIAGDGSRPI